MRKICVFNYKGGVGKTTTSINLAAGLSREGKKVLLVDLDPQGNVDLSLRLKSEHNLYDVMTGNVTPRQCIVNVAKNFDIITSRETLVKAEYYLSKQDDKRMLLKEILSSVEGYDYVLIDCPPSLGILNQNALAFADECFVPTSTDFLGFDALNKMKPIIERINETYNHTIRITKIVPTMFDKRNKLCKQTLADLQNEHPDMVGYPIRINSKVREAPKYGKSIFSYAKSSPGGKDYAQLVQEVIAMEQ